MSLGGSERPAAYGNSPEIRRRYDLLEQASGRQDIDALLALRSRSSRPSALVGAHPDRLDRHRWVDGKSS